MPSIVAPDGFDARFSALERRYAYRISDHGTPVDPLMRRHVLAYDRSLDVDKLNHASGTLTGLRDFAAFCRPRDGATTVRTLTELSWERVTGGPRRRAGGGDRARGCVLPLHGARAGWCAAARGVRAPR